MKRGFEENVSVNEGVNAAGVMTILHFEGDTLTVQKTYDAAPHLLRARQMREQQEGQTRWGDGKWVGHIPPVEYARMLAIPDTAGRRKALKQWLRDNQQFLGFAAYLKR